MPSKSSSEHDDRGDTHISEFGLDPSLDSIFRLLSSQRRRHVIYCLRENENPMDLADLVDEVASRENDAPSGEVSTTEVKHIHLSLYHTHVPKLNAADVVEYDKEEETVALTASDEQLQEYEKLLPDR